MTAIVAIVDEARATSRRVKGREDHEFVYGLLAAQIIGMAAHVSVGFARAGCPSTRPPKQPHLAVDEVSR